MILLLLLLLFICLFIYFRDITIFFGNGLGLFKIIPPIDCQSIELSSMIYVGAAFGYKAIVPYPGAEVGEVGV